MKDETSTFRPPRRAARRYEGSRPGRTVRWAAALAVSVLLGAGVTSAAETRPTVPEISTQGVVTLLARRYAWIWKVPPGKLRVEEVRANSDRARLVWVSGVPPDSGDGRIQHAFGMLAREAGGGRDLFTDLTPVIDTGYPAYTLATVDLVQGGPPAFAVGAPSAVDRPKASLYLLDPARSGAEGGRARLLAVSADLITLDRDQSGELRVQAGTYDFGETLPAVLEVSDSARLDPLGRPARAVAMTTYRWDPGRSAFSALQRAPELTPFGVAEAFVAAARRGDMEQALALTTAEWRRVMGVETPEQLKAYLQATRPYLLLSPGPFRFLGGTAGREAASILFTDPNGRIYRIRLRLVQGQASELMVVPGAAVPELRGPWQVDGLDGGS